MNFNDIILKYIDIFMNYNDLILGENFKLKLFKSFIYIIYR